VGSVGEESFRQLTARLEDSTSLSLGRPAPDAVIDPMLEGILQATLLYRTGSTDLLGHLDTDPIAGKEHSGWVVVAVPFGHPFHEY
jgi:hypothetical protein